MATHVAPPMPSSRAHLQVVRLLELEALLSRREMESFTELARRPGTCGGDPGPPRAALEVGARFFSTRLLALGFSSEGRHLLHTPRPIGSSTSGSRPNGGILEMATSAVRFWTG